MKEFILIDQIFSGIISKYNLHIDYLYFDQDAIRVTYRVFPPTVPVSPDSEGISSLTWWGHAKDDMGNSYQSAGGACGLSPDGTHTEGVFSFLPLPYKETSRLEIVMISERITPEFKCEFTVSLERLLI